MENAHRRLILGRRKRVTGDFPDLWLMCYPDDEDVRQSVEQVIEGMVDQVREQGTD